jgi:ribosome-binding factor A
VSARQRDGARRGAKPAGPSQRQLRVGEELRHALVEILRDSHARDPDLQDVNVTVTEVKISPDLSQATAFVMPFGGENGAATVAALNRASVYFRTQIARNVQLRHAPRVSFAMDTSFGYAKHINDLLNKPDVQRDLTNEPGAEAEEPVR